MAQVITQDDLDNNKGPAGQQQVSQPGQGVQASAPGTNAPSGGQQTGTQPNAGGTQQSTIQSYNPNTQKGSGYTNIQRIVQANQGNRLGQAVGGGIQQAGQNVQSGLQNAQQNFQQQSQENQFGTDQNQQLVQNVLQDPTKYAQLGTNDPNSQQGQQFQKLISGQYGGPQGLQNANQLQAQAADVGQLGQALGSTAGRIGVLQRFAGSPQYSSGQQNLDALLLGQTGGQDIAAARRAALGLQGQVGTQVGAAQQQAQQLTNQAQGFGQNVQQQLGQNLTNFDTNLQGQVTQQQAARDTAFKQAQDQLTSGTLNQDLANQLGITEGQQTFNIDPNKFISAGTAATEQNVAGAQDYARLAALKQLSGQFAPAGAQDVYGKFLGQEGQAGQFAAGPNFNVDKAGYQQALNDTSKQYHSQFDPAQGDLTSHQEISQLANQRQSLQDKLQNMSPADPNYQTIQNQMQDVQNSLISKYGSGIASGGVTRADWANTELQNAQQRYKNVLDSLNQQYGTNKYTVAPQDQQAAIGNLENTPKVT